MLSVKKVFVFTLLVSLFALTAFAQKSKTESDQTNYNETIYFESTALFKCGIKLPKNYDSHRSYTLVIALHGGGSSIEKFINIWDDVENTEFIYAVPQAPYAWLLNEKFGYDWALWPSGKETYIKQATNLIPTYLADLTKSLKKQYKIGKVYLLGFSQGAIFTYIAGINNYKLYDGIICLSGPGLLEPLVSPFSDERYDNWLNEDQIKKAKKLSTFIAHGKNDKQVKFELGLKSKQVLARFGYDVTFYGFEGGHTVKKDVLKQVVDWLMKWMNCSI